MPNNKIGARKNANFKAISTAPSFNKTPVGASTPPLPYPTTQDLGNSVGVVPTVKFNGDPVYVLNQTTQPSGKGDNPGVAKGVKSGTVTGEVKPVKGSSTVRAGGKPVIRDCDPCTMNGGNNPGIYTTTQVPSGAPAKSAVQTSNPSVQAAPPEKSLLERAAEEYKRNISASLHDFAEDAMDKGGTIAAAGGGTAAVGGVMVATGIGAAPGAVVVIGGGAVATVGGGVSAVGGITEGAATMLDGLANYLTGAKVDAVALATASAERVAMKKIDKLTKVIPGQGKKASKAEQKKGTTKSEKKGEPAGDGTTIVGSGKDGDCGIKPYKDQKCPKGQQAHHIVPDYALRYGNRKNSSARIPGMPSLKDGPSICLSGGSKTVGGEHNLAHEGTDPKIAATGQRPDNGPMGAAPIGEIIDISIDEVSKVKPHCNEEIKRKVDDAFKGVDRSKYGRTTQQPPKKGTETRGSLERGDRHGTTPRRRGK